MADQSAQKHQEETAWRELTSRVNQPPSRSSWPELVGSPGDEAKAKILQDNPRLTVHVVPQDSMVTMDFRQDRVRVFVNGSGHVERPPMVG